VKIPRVDFETYYRDIFGERWPALREALLRPGTPEPFAKGLVKPYHLDRASVIAALAPGEVGDRRVLDLCAAPGGKTLVLASSLGPQGCIVANERSSDRRRRLKAVLDEHLPPEVRRRIEVTGHDAARWGVHERDAYDLVLLDAPCSSERHVLQSPPHLAAWSPARTKHLAQQAYAMLLSALSAAKPGGFVLYSTCALSPLENDEVVARAAERKPGAFEAVPAPEALRRAGPPCPVGEATRFGRQIWPDVADGMGPIYYALLRKTV